MRRPLASRRGRARPSDDVLDRHHRDYRATGDAATFDRLVDWYSPFAYHLAARFTERGEPLEDLQQVALAALVLALRRFDPERGVRFTSYAGRCIVGELKRHLRDKTWAVRVGRSAQERFLSLRATVEELQHELGRQPTVPEVASRLGVREDDVLEAMDMAVVRVASSLDAPLPGDHEERVRDVPEVDEGFERVERKLQREQVLADLLPRLDGDERRLLSLYFGEGMSQAEVAAVLGISQVSVSRHLGRVIERLRVLAGASTRVA